jgi:hypothetical protein
MSFNKNRIIIKQAAKFYNEMTGKELSKEEYFDFENRSFARKKIRNNAKNGRLYLKCDFKVKDEAKELGVKWDFDNKMNYITKDISDKNIKKLLKIEKRLYGRNTTSGYIDYLYCVKIPKIIIIKQFDEEINIIPDVDDNIKESDLHLNFDEIKQILQDSKPEKNKNKNTNPFLK